MMLAPRWGRGGSSSWGRDEHSRNDPRENMEWLRGVDISHQTPEPAAQQAPGEGQNEVLFVFHTQLG